MMVTVQIAGPCGSRLDAQEVFETDAQILPNLLLELEMGRTRSGRLRPVQTFVVTDEAGRQETFSRVGRQIVADATGEPIAYVPVILTGGWKTCAGCERTTSTVKTHRLVGGYTHGDLCRECAELGESA